jgi:choline dehydrogenase-like flavoprotein
MGAIENARLLLHSDSTARGGVGNESGWVGRCFGDHPGWTIGRLQTRLPLPYAEYRTAGSLHLPHLSLRDDLLEELGMVNLGIMCLPLRGRVDLPIESVEDLEAAVEEASRVDPQAAVEEAGRVDRETGEPLPPQREWAQFHRVLARLESVPNPQSRVTLGRDRDPFGVRRVRLDWELDGIELETLDKLADLLGRRVGAHDLGRFHRTFWDGAAGRGAQLFYQSHQLGTTRMSADPDAGVVDADGRVHTVANLYLTGGSVFPTFGFTNPTLTVVALAVRLADHLVAVSRGG